MKEQVFWLFLDTWWTCLLQRNQLRHSILLLFIITLLPPYIWSFYKLLHIFWKIYRNHLYSWQKISLLVQVFFPWWFRPRVWILFPKMYLKCTEPFKWHLSNVILMDPFIFIFILRNHHPCQSPTIIIDNLLMVFLDLVLLIILRLNILWSFIFMILISIKTTMLKN